MAEQVIESTCCHAGKSSDKRSTTRVLELYSGIGGMHFALQESGLNAEVAAAVDINNIANDIYRHNFPDVKLLQRSIESLSVRELERLCVDLVLMSPPCQPFTRVGLQKDSEDLRTKSFFHFLEMLTQLSHKPNYLLLENVKGFDTSQTREWLIATLRKADYNIQEFLLTPLQLGVPNSRLRYFLLARRTPFNFPVSESIHMELPNCAEDFLTHKVRLNVADSSCEVQHANEQINTKSGVNEGSSLDQINNVTHSQDNIIGCSTSHDQSQKSTNSHMVSDDQSDEKNRGHMICDDDQSEGSTADETETECSNIASYEKYRSICQPLTSYLENQPEDYYKDFMIPEKFFKRFWVMDIVKSDARNCCCFTKRYGHHIEGAGSIIQMKEESQVDLRAFKVRRVYDDHVHESVRSLQLRFFSPREIANIMCFPSNFSFPAGVSTIQCYRVLGNSLNVHMVSVLIRLLTLGDNR